MTRAELVAIVTDTVKQMLAVYRLRVFAYAFIPENQQSVLAAAKTINGCAELFVQDSVQCDVMVLDCIPAQYLAELALGLEQSPIANQLQAMVREGKKVFVLNSNHRVFPHAPAAYGALCETYLQMLESYGYVFLDTGTTPSTIAPLQAVKNTENRKPYTGNVLSRKELLENAVNGKLFIGAKVVVTPLAAETASKHKISIVRSKGG